MKHLHRIALLWCALALTAHADELLQGGVESAVADCVSTGQALALSSHIAEANPLGPIAACALKPAALYWANGQPEPRRTSALQGIEALWTGAAVNNVIALVAQGAAYWAPAIGIGVAVAMWFGGAEERAFMEQCAIHRQLAHDPELKCVYRKEAADAGTKHDP